MESAWLSEPCCSPTESSEMRNTILVLVAVSIGTAAAWMTKRGGELEFPSYAIDRVSPADLDSGTPGIRNTIDSNPVIVRKKRPYSMQRPMLGAERLATSRAETQTPSASENRFIGDETDPEPDMMSLDLLLTQQATIFIGEAIAPEPDLANISLADAPSRLIGGPVLIEPPI